MHQCDKKHSTDPSVEIAERVNPLKPPVSPGKKFGETSKCAFTFVTKALGEVVAELANMDGDLKVVRRSMCSDLDVPVPEPAGPIREQVAGQGLVLLAEPLRRDGKLVGGGSDHLLQNRGKRDGNALGDLCVGEDSFGRFFVAGGAYLLA